MKPILHKLCRFLIGPTALLFLTLCVPLDCLGIDNTCVAEAAVKLSSTNVQLPKNCTYTLHLSNAGKSVTWSSSRSSVASVKNGVVTPKKVGTTIITAKANGRKYTCKVTVLNVKLNSNHVTMSKGKTYALKVTGAKRKPTYRSNKASVVSVHKTTGKLTARKKGSAIITVSTGSQKFSVFVTVEDPSLNKKSLNLKKGASYTLKIVSKRSVKWSSNNSSVASVASNGKVTAKKTGTAVITGKVSDKSFTCTVQVTTPTSVSCPATINLQLGKTANYKIIPGDGFHYTSSFTHTTSTLSPSAFVAGQALTLTISGTNVGKDTFTFTDQHGYKKTVTVVVSGSTLPTFYSNSSLTGISFTSFRAYKGPGDKPWLNVFGTIKVTEPVNYDTLYVGYTFYDKEDTALGTYYYPLTDAVQDHSYSFSHSFSGTQYNWTADVASVRVTDLHTY